MADTGAVQVPSTSFGHPRTVTVLFTDLVSSTAVLNDLGDELYGLAIEAHLDLLAACVAEHLGEPVKNVGDGIMAVFDRAEDAVDCAVHIQQAATFAAQRPGEPPFRLRVGLSAGEPIELDGDYFGTTVVEAARLCAAADAGQILASAAVADHLAAEVRVPLEQLGPMVLKGLPAAMQVWQVGWTAGDASVMPDVGRAPRWNGVRAAPPASPLVGREPERSRMMTRWALTRSGLCQVVFIGGAPGIGKTALILDLVDEVEQTGGRALMGGCSADLGFDLQPFVEALGPIVETWSVSWLRTHVRSDLRELVGLFPLLTRRFPRLQSSGPHDAAGQRLRMFEALAGLIRAVAAGHRLLLVLDDLQWAGDGTFALLRHLVRRLDRVSLMIVGAYRDPHRNDALRRLLHDVAGWARAECITLDGLSPAALAEVIDVEAPGTFPDGARLTVARTIHAETGGNPLLAAEVLRELLDAGPRPARRMSKPIRGRGRRQAGRA